jgi:hypothetical protein
MGKCKLSILNLFSKIYFCLSNEALLVPLETQSEQRKDCKKRMISLVEWEAFSLQQPNLGPTQEQTLHNKLVAPLTPTGFNDASSS